MCKLTEESIEHKMCLCPALLDVWNIYLKSMFNAEVIRTIPEAVLLCFKGGSVKVVGNLVKLSRYTVKLWEKNT